MNKQELKEQIVYGETLVIKDRTTQDMVEMVSKSEVLDLIDQLDEPQKPTVPSVALEYYEAYVDKLTGFDEWFGDFFDRSFLEEFPKAEELSEWLYDNDTKTNLERELALATLVVKGPSAVKIEKEKLYTVEIPDPNSEWKYTTLTKIGDNRLVIDTHNFDLWKSLPIHQLTESEIRKDFEWAWQAGFAKEVDR